jgi:KDO2-lipid IV(A) lauroyltransferase
LHDGRRRFGQLRLFHRNDGVKAIVSALRAGDLFYLLPDMNFGRNESVFVPFYGVPAATVPSLSRFARLGRAQVVPVVSRMTDAGYEIEVMPAWENFPSDDAIADTALMNQRLQGYIDTMPSQYYWVHKRFKDQPNSSRSSINSRGSALSSMPHITWVGVEMVSMLCGKSIAAAAGSSGRGGLRGEDR